MPATVTSVSFFFDWDLARIWVERRPVSDEENTEFVVHIVRANDEGAVSRDTVDTLSETEREVVGIVIALAYIVHDIERPIQFSCMDSVEMIDGERMAALLDSIQNDTVADFTVVALLPTEARAQSTRDGTRSPADQGGRILSTTGSVPAIHP